MPPRIEADPEREVRLAELLRPTERRQPRPEFRHQLRSELLLRPPTTGSGPTIANPSASAGRLPLAVALLVVVGLTLGLGLVASRHRAQPLVRDPGAGSQTLPRATVGPILAATSVPVRATGAATVSLAAERRSQPTVAPAARAPMGRPGVGPGMWQRPGTPRAAVLPTSPMASVAEPFATGERPGAQVARTVPAAPPVVSPDPVPPLEATPIATPTATVLPTSVLTPTIALPATSTPEPTSTGRPTTTPCPEATPTPSDMWSHRDDCVLGGSQRALLP